jgi:hypothetical protein
MTQVKVAVILVSTTESLGRVMAQTDRIGVNAVEGVILNDFDWLFRELCVPKTSSGLIA